MVFMTPYAGAQVVQKRVVTLMGSRFDLTVVAPDAQQGQAYIDTAVAEITRIERLISEWDASSKVSEINQNAGIKPVQVPRELFDLTARALEFSKLTQGAFDISWASMDRIWKFDGSMKEMPDSAAVRRSVARVGYQNIILNPKKQTVYLRKKNMKIGFGATGKGYAADKTKALLVSKGVPAGIVNASGDMNAWGAQPDGQPWLVGITNPINPEKTFAHFALSNGAVVTSGTYEKFATIAGKRYSHIIDPRTGYPAAGLASVTVFAPSAETANGLSTAIVVLGAQQGLALVNGIPGVRCVIVTDSGDILTSKNLSLEPPAQD